MRAETEVPGLSFGGQKTHFEDAAGVGNIGLDVIGAIQVKEFPVPITVVEPLAGGQRYPNALLNFAESFQVVGRYRLLEPEDIEFLKLVKALRLPVILSRRPI